MRHSLIKTVIATMMLTATSVPAIAAKDMTVDQRVGKLEKEMTAVQRKVFPGGVPVQPDITAQSAAPELPPASSPVADLMARVTSLESQLATLTGQVEQNSYRLKQVEQQIETMKAATAAAASAPPELSSVATPATKAPISGAAAGSGGAAPKAAATGPSETRKAAVAAVERPDTGDAANDAYSYGFRLWEAKFYPEAQAQLKTTLEKFGNASVGSRTQNLLGRAYLDDGKPTLASLAFYENYQKRPTGDRAAQSLVYLGEALLQLKKPADACKVYGQIAQDYQAQLTTDLRALVDKGRARAKCGA